MGTRRPFPRKQLTGERAGPSRKSRSVAVYVADSKTVIDTACNSRR